MARLIVKSPYIKGGGKSGGGGGAGGYANYIGTRDLSLIHISEPTRLALSGFGVVGV